MRGVHEMSLVETSQYGVAEMMCSICGRRMLMKLAPGFSRIILTPGDEKVNHASVIAGRRIINVPVNCEPYRNAADDEWLNDIGISWGADAD